MSSQLLDPVCQLSFGHVLPQVHWRRGQSFEFPRLRALRAGEGQNCRHGIRHDALLHVRLHTWTHILWLDLRSHVPRLGQDVHEQGQLLALRSQVHEVGESLRATYDIFY